MNAKVKPLGRCERGTSVIEFALAAPFVAALLLGMIELSKAYSDRLELEQAAQRTIERVQQERTVSSDYSSLKAEAALAAGIAATPNNPTVEQWLECTSTGDTRHPLTDQCPDDADIPARYVTITIEKTYTPIIGLRYLGADSNGNYTLTGEAGIRVQ